jgi:alkaline phosphatase D
VITDNRSYRSQPIVDHADFEPFRVNGVPFFLSQNAIEILDAGRAYQGGAPDTIAVDGRQVPNPRRQHAPQSILGARQKAWFLARLRESTAPWKLWGNSIGMLNWRTDLQNLPADGPRWPFAGFGQMGDDDWSAYCTERNEILDVLRAERIAGLVSIAGDRHSFLAGLLSTTLPPEGFTPVAVEFGVGSVSAPGLAEAAQYGIKPDDPIRPLYLYDADPGSRPQPALNVSLMHGVRASLALQRTRRHDAALAARNPDVAPHLSFADVAGHGYATVRVERDAVEVEFVCVPRPLERAATDDGGPLAYRVVHRTPRWRAGERPSIARRLVEGTLPLVL